MSDIIQQTVFPGSGLNTDDDERYIANGDAPYRLNVMISGDEAHGVLTNMLGNTRTVDITDHLLTLSNVYMTIGSHYNRLTRKMYYFVFSQPYDSDGSGDYLYDNKLFCYNEDQNTLDLIFTDTKNYFGLHPDYLMKDCVMIGDWLYFNPRQSEPKMIDVVRAYNYTNYDAYSAPDAYVYGDKVTYYGGLFMANTAVAANETPITTTAKWDRIGDSYQDETGLNFDSEFRYAFNVIKMPPVDRPNLVYSNDDDIQSNNVRGKLFRFAYRYKYFDNSYSVYSAYSDISLPIDNESYNGEILNEVTFNNLIVVSVYPHSAALIKEIEIVFQETGSDWKRARVINRQEQYNLDQTSTFFNFYNNESYVQVPNINVAKIEDSVPKEAGAQELINLNILTYGGCKEGFDNLDKNDITVSLTPVLEEFSAPATMDVIKRDNLASGDILTIKISSGTDYRTYLYFTNPYIPVTWWTSIAAGDLFTTAINGKSVTYTVQPADVGGTINTFMTAIHAHLAAKYSEFSISLNLSSKVIVINNTAGRATFTRAVFYTPAAAGTAPDKRRGFKTGANHPFCIFYYDDNMRRWDAQVSKTNIKSTGWTMLGTTTYVPMFNEETVLPATTGARYTIDWEVNHMPPEGAKYWRWGYAGNSLCSYMVQYIIENYGPDTTGNLTGFDITPLQTLKTTEQDWAGGYWNQFPNSIIDQYVWEKGDRVRFITKGTNPAVGGTVLGDIIDGVYDFEIVKYDDSTSGAYWIYVQLFDPTAFTASGIGVNTLVEIYRPLKSVSDTKLLYYEFGDIMPIDEDSVGVMVHYGQNGVHNQDTGTSASATGSFDGGDIYHIVRTPSKPLCTATPSAFYTGAYHESMWYSDFYDSDDYDRGKIGVETTFGERYLNIVRYSNQYIQNTKINGLSTFEGENFKEVNDIYGDIKAIYEQGDTLKVYQERKASSILIGRTEYYDSQGSPNAVALSSRVLGSIRYSPSNYSTVFPESIGRNNKFIYGFDIYNGVVWRDSVNGLFPISGRYAEAGGDADYKMQTYFKLKAKALLESGIDHVDIMGCWDEEYKMYYLAFKDFVEEANNEVIVFHEPSNRWISFMSLEQTPAEGYNVLLEPTFEIVKGFAAGIGIVFNEDTRFFEFDIATPANYNVGMDLAALVITAYDPASVVVNETSTADVAAVTIIPYDPASAVITDPPNVVLLSIDDIPSGAHGSYMPVVVNYSNTGDGVTQSVSWKLTGTLSGETTGSESVSFSELQSYGQIVLTSLTYPSPSDSYILELDGLITKQFYST